ncbi:histidine phosphatase family protein [Bacillus cereus]|uniref:histidine phosphatase family protein n=1 Tax=Bacillus cereus group TaxID=86661 RepID=UPI000BF34555|nr:MULTISPECIES: histidine phosphatase family protein [Bacillus cereus group]MED3527887.1 histidine phosphatase family protein [Bacillus thuringiensis]PEQ54095.1 histidine phosphatase family protein [Bacillus thuringiensis]PEZ33378.1 histidine phosphatase family protein [Bacillus cereus]PFS47252.1 histidine phosphatase family protein [Bacillus thuringiensis]PFU09240.1 histidine phosphatase family protein [Bacillus cereus]
MELIFARHGEGEHNTEEPNSFQILHPRLTAKGIKQAKDLKKQFNLQDSDVIIASPTYRTLQTAEIFSYGKLNNLFFSYAASPRIYPYRKSAKTLPCDVVLENNKIIQLFPQFKNLKENLNNIDILSINAMNEKEFSPILFNFLQSCKNMNTDRVFIFSHDGAINFFKEHILNQKFTRMDMLDTAKFTVLYI